MHSFVLIWHGCSILYDMISYQLAADKISDVSVIHCSLEKSCTPQQRSKSVSFMLQSHHIAASGVGLQSLKYCQDERFLL